MLVVFLSLLLIISCFVFFDKRQHIYTFSSIIISNISIYAKEKSELNFLSLSKVFVSKSFAKENTFKTNCESDCVQIKNEQLKKELDANLKHLEFILSVEDQLGCLTSPDKCALERLEEFMKIKNDVQIKIITLTQSLINYKK